MMEPIDKRIQQEVFRIMRHKLKGKTSDVELKCWQMTVVAKAIYERFNVAPYKIRLKHLIWYIDEVLFWIPSKHTCYRRYLAIKAFCLCCDKWGHWQNQLSSKAPR